jgi:hypothetical protein
MWKQIQNTDKLYLKFYLEDEPEVLHIVKTGFNDRYICLYENAFETEPWQSGIMWKSADEILKEWNIEIL